MLKFLLCSAIALPCTVLPFITADNVEAPLYETATFAEAYQEPRLDKIAQCEDTQIGIFFHEELLESHSAEYIRNSVEEASSCHDANYIIHPLSTENPSADYTQTLHAQAQELSLTLEAYGITAVISDPVLLDRPDSLLLNGRTAFLEIDLSTESRS